MARPEIHAERSANLQCKGWHQEAALRLLMNNLDPEVAERPEELVVYGGDGKAARNWKAYEALVRCLKELENDETLLVQSGKPVGIMKTHPESPRVLIANSLLVPEWANWEHFRWLERRGLIMYGQMTAGSWIYIGTQGILQGTYETLASLAATHFDGDLRGKIVLTGGLGGMGGAQPLATTLNQGVIIAVEVDRSRIQRRLDTGYLDLMTDSLDEALQRATAARDSGEPLSIGLLGNTADILPAMVYRGFVPDVVTDQTSAHDALNGYVPGGLSYQDALELRKTEPDEYIRRSYESMARHVETILAMKDLGAVAFDYGNNLRGQAKKAGVERAFDYPGFVPAYIRPLFCQGKGPFRWVALSGDPRDIGVTDEIIRTLFPEDAPLMRWIDLASTNVPFQGLPARICWLGYGARARFGLEINRAVREGRISAPIAIGRDHLDCGSVASPNRETEDMKDGSDAIADWPVLNGLLNAISGASWVSVHHGGGVGMGLSIHAGMVIVADGSREMDIRLERVLTNDPGLGILRHADAGYSSAVEIAGQQNIPVPMGT